MLCERAFVEDMLLVNPELGEAVLRQRAVHAAQFMQDERAALVQALEHPAEAPYAYRFNYPVAVVISGLLDADAMWSLFTGDLPLSNAMDRCDQAQPDVESCWALVVAAAKDAFQFARDEIEAAADQMVAHLSPDLPQNSGVAAGAFGTLPVIRCRVSAQPEDMLNLAGVFCEALSLQMSRRVAPSASGRAATRALGRQSLARSLGHLAAVDEGILSVPASRLDTQMLWDLMIGDAPVSYLACPGNILQILPGSKETSDLTSVDLLLPHVAHGIAGLARPNLTGPQLMEHMPAYPHQLWPGQVGTRQPGNPVRHMREEQIDRGQIRRLLRSR
jgi:hypothetical protein